LDALTFLRQDHKSVLGMLEVLNEAPSGSGAEISGLETMVTNLVIAESQREAIEEQFFCPAVRDALEDGDALADEAIKQEQDGKKLLQRLADGKPGEADTTRHYSNSLRPATSTSPMSRMPCGHGLKPR
jgi:Hemerythrin HHE cation binding domain